MKPRATEPECGTKNQQNEQPSTETSATLGRAIGCIFAQDGRWQSSPRLGVGALAGRALPVRRIVVSFSGVIAVWADTAHVVFQSTIQEFLTSALAGAPCRRLTGSFSGTPRSNAQP